MTSPYLSSPLWNKPWGYVAGASDVAQSAPPSPAVEVIPLPTFAPAGRITRFQAQQAGLLSIPGAGSFFGNPCKTMPRDPITG
jgi:hypothetical protein